MPNDNPNIERLPVNCPKCGGFVWSCLGCGTMTEARADAIRQKVAFLILEMLQRLDRSTKSASRMEG